MGSKTTWMVFSWKGENGTLVQSGCLVKVKVKQSRSMAQALPSTSRRGQHCWLLTFHFQFSEQQQQKIPTFKPPKFMYFVWQSSQMNTTSETLQLKWSSHHMLLSTYDTAVEPFPTTLSSLVARSILGTSIVCSLTPDRVLTCWPLLNVPNNCLLNSTVTIHRPQTADRQWQSPGGCWLLLYSSLHAAWSRIPEESELTSPQPPHHSLLQRQELSGRTGLKLKSDLLEMNRSQGV